MTTALTDADKIRMALSEAGRPDLAEALRSNRVGAAMIGYLIRDFPDVKSVEVIARAAYLARKDEAWLLDFDSEQDVVTLFLNHPYRHGHENWCK